MAIFNQISLVITKRNIIYNLISVIFTYKNDYDNVRLSID